MNRARTYLDWNASAPLLPEARAAMLAALDVTGNPSSVHGEGRAARRIVEDAREHVARLVGARPQEVVFTSGASEANNAVIRAGWPAIFATDIEHDSVRAPIVKSATLHALLGVSRDGVVGALPFEARLADSLAEGGDAAGSLLITLQHANNETGVLQPLAEIAAFARKYGIRMHTDATQAVGRVPVDIAALGVDYLSFSSHKLGGPKGAGALIVREGAPFAPLIVGGGQERRQRAGTENVAAIAGFGAAARVASAGLAGFARVAKLRDRLEAEVVRSTPAAVIIASQAPRLANTSCIALSGRAAETLVAAFDLAGIAVSAGAACSSGKVAESHVLTAMGLAPDITRSAIRVSIGPTTDDNDIAAFLAAWNQITRSVAGAHARAA